MDFDINNLDFINNLMNSLNLGLGVTVILFNTLLIYILFTKVSLKSLELRIILFLSFMELVIGTELITVAISKLIQGYHLFDAANLSCQVHGVIVYLLIRYEIIVVSVLAIWRYLLVIHNIQLNIWVWLGILVIFFIFIVVIYLYGALTQPLKPSPSYIQCLPFASPGVVSFSLTMTLTLLNIGPCWITTFCYFAIGWKVNKRLNELNGEAKETSDLEAMKAIRSQKFKLILQLLLVFILYNVDFMISYITYFLRLSTGYQRSPFLDASTVSLAYLSVIGTPIVTISFQPEVNNEVKFIFVKLEAKVKSAYNSLFNR